MTQTNRVRISEAVVVLIVSTGCAAANDAGKKAPSSVPSSESTKFLDRVSNPWMPWAPGTRWVFTGKTDEGIEHTVIKVTDRTKLVTGVATTVVHDVVYRNGKLLEDTYDWYAQDNDGNVWYFGEDTKEYDAGKVDTAGSWEAGVDGAHAGIVMLAHPTVGRSYRQEYDKGNAEDQAKVVASGKTVTVPFGHLTGLLETRDFTGLEPHADEHKFYAKGIGVVVEQSIEQHDRTELVGMTPQP